MDNFEDEFLTEVETTIKTQKTKRKKGINSKKKGNRAELDLAHILNERFEGYTFARSVQSGAYIGKSNDVRAETMSQEQILIFAGDIRTPINFKFVIEHKAYNSEGHEIFWEIFNEKSDIHKWMEQVLHDSKVAKKQPMLVVKYNFHERIVFLTDIGKDFPLIPKFTTFFLDKEWSCFYLKDLLELQNSYFFD